MPEKRQESRRWLASEVIQSSTMDCGMSALKSLLDGYRIPVNYTRLRDACHTSVDGTSLDTLEEIAKQLGLEAEQVVVSEDCFVHSESGTLPALVLMVTPTGFTHLVVVWRRHGPFWQVMDPGRGRRWVRWESFRRALYIHHMVFEAEAFSEWARSEEVLGPLRRRLDALGIPKVDRDTLIEEQLARDSWRGLATLDAAVRMARSLVRSKALRKGEPVTRFIRAAVEQTLPDGHEWAGPPSMKTSDFPLRPSAVEDRTAPYIPLRFWSVFPTAPGEEGEEQIILEGMVAICVLGRRPSILEAEVERSPSTDMPEELRAALREPPAKIGRELLRFFRSGGWLVPLAMLVAAVLVALGEVLQAVPMAGVLNADQWRDGSTASYALIAALILIPTLALGASALVHTLASRSARGLELRVRRAIYEKLPRLRDQYFSTRPSIGLAVRAHNIHALRSLPTVLAGLTQAGAEILLASVAIALFCPSGLLVIGIAVILGLGVYLASQPMYKEAELRALGHYSAAGHFNRDALSGPVPIRTHGAQTGIRRRQEDMLVSWDLAERRRTALDLSMKGAGDLLLMGLLFAVPLIYLASGTSPLVVLLVAYWVWLLTRRLSELLSGAAQIPALKNQVQFILEPLQELEDEEPTVEVTTEDCLHRNEEPCSRQDKEPLVKSVPKAGSHEYDAPRDIEGESPTADSISENRQTEAAELRKPKGEDREEPSAPVSHHWIADGLREMDGEGRPARSSRTDTAVVDRPVAIEFDRVRLNIGGLTIIQDLSLSIDPGTHVAIIGRSGAGKTSLMGLLLGWHYPTRGRVLVQGAPLSPRRLEELRRVTAWIDPAVHVWNRSLSDNIGYGVPPDLSRPIDRVIDDSLLREPLERLEQGLMTPLGENGGLLSGGENQRVRFARAMRKKEVHLVVMDEPFRGLDAQRRSHLMGRVRSLWKDATLICVSHDMSITPDFDQVVVMDEGRIIEQGSPEELSGWENSAYRQRLDAERAVRQRLWHDRRWRRITMRNGRIIELTSPKSMQSAPNDRIGEVHPRSRPAGAPSSGKISDEERIGEGHDENGAGA